MARTVAGTWLLPNGQPMANARIYFVAKRTEAVSIVDGANASFTTSAAGVYSQNIVNGYYAVSIEVPGDLSGTNPRRYPLGDVYIEDGASTTIEALLIATNPPEDLALGVFYEMLEQAQAAAASASASAAAAAASAASITPTSSATDETAGRLRRTQDSPGYSKSNTFTGINTFTVSPVVPTPAVGDNSTKAASAAFVQAQKTTSATDTTSGRVWRTDDLVKTTNGFDATAGRVAVFHGDTGIFGIGGRTSDGDGNAFAQSGLYRTNNVTSGLPAAFFHALHIQRIAGAQSAQLLIRDGTGTGDSNIAGIRRRDNLGAWEAPMWLWSDKTLPVVSGSFTPTVVGGTTSGTGTYGVQQGRYTKIGDVVEFTIRLTWTAHTGTGAINIQGLPFVTAGNPRPTAVVYANTLTIGSGKQLGCIVDAASTNISLFAMDVAGGNTSAIPMDTNVSELLISGKYFV